jgi:DNA-binding MarR family transcriptional regulator
MTRRITAPLNRGFFYSLERAIKAYRQFAQARIDDSGIDITVDQWLVLRTLQESPDLTQQQVGLAVFKDFASIARIVQLLVRKRYLRRTSHPRDARRSALVLTAHGMEVIRALEPVILRNRRRALRGIPPADVLRAQGLLDTVSRNCHLARSR